MGLTPALVLGNFAESNTEATALAIVRRSDLFVRNHDIVHLRLWSASFDSSICPPQLPTSVSLPSMNPLRCSSCPEVPIHGSHAMKALARRTNRLQHISRTNTPTVPSKIRRKIVEHASSSKSVSQRSSRDV